MSIRATTKVGSEPIPGYILRKRLGAGGYGEVWLADAPGGLQKAVKLIYGNVDQSHATSELRSLQRIRQVYHPFLLSIERIEIVDSQVVIVTELAESSLLDRFEMRVRQGAPGIDRGPLLDFMRDAADALDFLAQKHSLQHLDVKPGNLLIIADRIKVADFGLIKDLHDQNQSLVSGLTPTYSAPEIFDGRPDYRSDQYSLAIVYMEMLCGQVPFSGRTTGELARQHLTSVPDLESLPPADRPIVARALAKNPLDRYGTCRLFVEQLTKTRGAVLLPQRQLGQASETLGQSYAQVTEKRPTSTSRNSAARQFRPAMDLSGISKQWQNPRSMFIGLGGLGCRAVAHVRRQSLLDCDNRLTADDHAWTAIDTDGESLAAITNPDSETDSLPSKSAIELPIFRPAEYRNAQPDLFRPLSRRWLYNIPRSLKTEGVRPLAILSLLDNYPMLHSRLAAEVAELIKRHEADEDCSEPLRLYVLSSLHGGTGSALLAEIGYLVRRIFNELGFSNYRLCAVGSVATTTHNHGANLQTAAGLATLSELTYTMSAETEVPALHFSDEILGSTVARPFDWVTLLDGGMYGNVADVEKTVHELGVFSWLDSQSLLGAALSDDRSTFSETLSAPLNLGNTDWLRAASVARVSVASGVNAANLARWCCEQALLHALQYMSGPKGVATSCMQYDATQGAPTVSGDFPLTENACDDFFSRLLQAWGMRDAEDQADRAEQQQLRLAAWQRRTAASSDLVAAQLRSDKKVWNEAVARIVKLRVYNWKQIEQIQLKAIESIVNFYESDSGELQRQIRPLLGLLKPQKAEQSAKEYLRKLGESCLESLGEFQREGRHLAKRIASWCSSISAEKALNEASWDVNLSGLPPMLQLLANRVNSVLESTVHRLATQLVSGEAEKPMAPGSGHEQVSADSFNLRFMLTLSTDLVSRLAEEMGLSADELSGAANKSDIEISFKQLESFLPTLALSSSRLFRFVVAPSEHTQLTLSALKKHKLESHTTVIACRRSMDSFVVCDSRKVAVNRLIAELWRPSPVTLQLAERLRTRVDVDWEPAASLLEYGYDSSENDSGENDSGENDSGDQDVIATGHGATPLFDLAAPGLPAQTQPS